MSEKLLIPNLLYEPVTEAFSFLFLFRESQRAVVHVLDQVSETP
jgi:hypothetical protein